ncbi:helix-turn-helix domain-containing protein [Streptomyces sp. NBC_01267]|uniref:helix-turn-helix domain-containing protein n=1 Tax=unclassified Streptomyces TaxID=2593676 RepID=UPI002DD85D25|nr:MULTISPECIES: helix-turn-helix transcriptional regulator [unclassified Streptomyces]WSC20190.1 helix-turn-helix domain-containing protein [Streptomyces sp. NBC_01766]WSV54207.1 helix-turn-helix domain-containing protein [Streptomyces sp. NBC_01014]
MPPRHSPTARQRRLGTELRRLRERAGLSTVAASASLGIDRAKLSGIEAGRVGVSDERLRAMACHYDCADQGLVDALAALNADRGRRWWDEYRGVLPTGLLDLVELEYHATELVTAQTSHLPGLLHTIDHARVVFQQAVPPLPPHEVEHRLSHRIKRQEIFHRASPTPYTAIIHEAALRMEFGGPAVAQAQLEHLASASERDHVTVLVIPFKAGAFPGSGQSFVYAHGPVGELDTVHLDQSHGPALIDAEAPLEKYRLLLDRMREVALDPTGSRGFIRSVADSLRQGKPDAHS